ncbi:MAG: mannose-1-phosphate guanylyltransferase [Phycisphaerae bacterium]|jgi:mannose-1-phosphate guanylyltransferase|nr:mannose-1-phosphate guanylyltransferase [Phycisphaerae bacterium]
MLHAVIMAGGKGTRFWPLSRQKRPKQFLNLVGAKSMLAQTLERIQPLVARDGICVSTSHQLLGEARKIAGSSVPRKNWILEPVGRNTAPCLALAAFKLHKRDPDAVMICLPADHLIKPKRKFHATLRRAAQLARANDALVLLGIEPQFPSTGFGYIRRGESIKLAGGKRGYRVKAFIEKPPLAKAKKMVAAGDCYWNSGIFVWKAAVFLEEVERYLPKHFETLQKVTPLLNTPKEEKALKRAFAKMESISVDYGIMQRSRKSAMIPADFEWDDVGNWVAASRYWPRDANQNAVVGQFYGKDVQRAAVYTTNSGKLVAVVGLKDIVIVDTDDALLVFPSKDSQKIRDLVEDLRKSGWSEKV